MDTDKHEHYHIEGEHKAFGAISPIPVLFATRQRRRFKTLSNISYEENPYFHPEPYGYLVSDDVKIN